MNDTELGALFSNAVNIAKVVDFSCCGRRSRPVLFMIVSPIRCDFVAVFVNKSGAPAALGSAKIGPLGSISRRRATGRYLTTTEQEPSCASGELLWERSGFESMERYERLPTQSEPLFSKVYRAA
ncbi:hypothetical protein ACVSQB_38650 [Bradyrhizobium elkanii]